MHQIRFHASAGRSATRLLATGLALFATVVLLLFGRALASETPEVVGVRFGINEAVTRVVLDVDRPVRFGATVLADPPRLVVDLDDVRWRVREHPQNRPVGLAQSVTYGRLGPERARLVVDVGRPFRIVRQEQLAPSAEVRHHRILIDITALPPPAPAAVAAAPATARPAAATARAPQFARPLPRPVRVARATADPALGAIPAPPSERPEDVTLAAVPAAPLRPADPPLRRRVVVIDAGHGGIDPGTIGINGVPEKVITRQIADRLTELIEGTGRYDVVLTRRGDEFVALRDRIQRAHGANASLFISIHADSLADARLRGASVYTLSDTASDSEAALLAAKENKADIIAGTDLSAHDEVVAGILIDLAQRDTNNKSIEFADVLTAELGEVTRLLRNTRRFAGFVVLKSPDTPSVLLELGYLSNPTDAANLADPAYQKRLAEATLRAIDRYFGVTQARS
ncbi:MAG: N-acetylmuramoyl-L-alanine amidase [Geminicoccaceae bacterium]|nr:N-acetylmuramoyl-L-alanine amidase [Geminicoccaceae bacterium]